MAVGYLLRVGDKTTCNGEILTGDLYVKLDSYALAIEGSLVSCGKHSGQFEIIGGVNSVQASMGKAAGNLNSLSSCPCKAMFIPTHTNHKYMEEINTFKTTRSPSLSGHSVQPNDINPLKNSISDIPVLRDPNLDKSLHRRGVKLLIMINNNGIGHVGLMLERFDNYEEILYDPAGSYTGCYQMQCKDGAPTHRGSGDIFYEGFFDWDDYLAYQLYDGPKVKVYEFIISENQAKIVHQQTEILGGAAILYCATTVAKLLQSLGGDFSNISEPFMLRSPWALDDELSDIFYPKRGGFIRGAY